MSMWDGTVAVERLCGTCSAVIIVWETFNDARLDVDNLKPFGVEDGNGGP